MLTFQFPIMKSDWFSELQNKISQQALSTDIELILYGEFLGTDICPSNSARSKTQLGIFSCRLLYPLSPTLFNTQPQPSFRDSPPFFQVLLLIITVWDLRVCRVVLSPVNSLCLWSRVVGMSRNTKFTVCVLGGILALPFTCCDFEETTGLFCALIFPYIQGKSASN